MKYNNIKLCDFGFPIRILFLSYSVHTWSDLTFCYHVVRRPHRQKVPRRMLVYVKGKMLLLYSKDILVPHKTKICYLNFI